MAQYEVKIESVLWQKPNRGAIVRAALIEDDIPSEEKRIRFPHNTIFDDMIQAGQWWCIEGEDETWQGNPQIGVTEAVLLRPSGQHIKALLAGDKFRFPGIGEAYAERLWDKLGNKLSDLLNDKKEFELAQVMRGLKIPTPDDLAEVLIDGWTDLGYGEVITWLDSLPAKGNFGIWVGKKVCKCWGKDARKRIEEDPYRLHSFYKEKRRDQEWAAWRKVDEIAQQVFQVEEDDERRLHGAIIESLFKAYDNRDTIVHRDVLLKKVEGRLGSKKLAAEALNRTYGKNSFLRNDEWFQARGAFLMEKEVAERVAQTMRFKKFEMFGEASFAAKEIDSSIEEFEAIEGYRLGPDQRGAVHLCLNNRLAVITGGAGTGKTTILKAVYHVIKKAGGEIAQMALAGRAARRMSEATQRPARTIAGFVNDHETAYTGDTTFVIDESSMLDLPMTLRALRHLPQGCRLILVGDAEQLPPIGPGLVFHLLVNELRDAVPTVELKRVYRQSDKSGIPAVAAAIRGDEKNTPALPELPEYSGVGSGVSVCSASSNSIADTIKKVYADLCETPEGERDPEKDVQVLAIVNNNKPHGVAGINTAFHMKYSRGRKRVIGHTEENAPWKAPAQFAEGEPVIWNYNDWERELLNGTLGVIEKAYDYPDEESLYPSEHLSAEINFDTGSQDVTVGDLESMKLAYAITVHKSQGSQFKRVIIPVVKEPLMDKSLLYTAVTRGVEQVVLVGDIEAARDAVKNGAAADQRTVGLGHLLRLALEGAA